MAERDSIAVGTAYRTGQLTWIVCPTRSDLENLARELRLSTDTRWHAVFHALPDLHFPEKQAARKMLGWDVHLRYVVAVGQLIPLKRFELLIDAMATLPDDCRLILLGDGDRAPYQAQAAGLGIAAPVMTSTEDISSYLAAADIFVSTSSTESFGMTILEATAAGLPVVCTKVGAVEEVVGDVAELVSPDADGLARRINHVLNDSTRYAELVRKSRTRGETGCWPDQIAVAQRYHAIYAVVRKI